MVVPLSDFYAGSISVDCLLLVPVERTAGRHVVNLVLDGLKDFGIFIGTFGGDSIDNISVLGDGCEDGVDELYDVNHVLLHKSA